MDHDVRALEAARRRSRRAVPTYVVLLVAFSVASWTLSRWVAVPWWIVAVLLGVTGFGLVMDLVNIWYCTAKLEKARR